MQKPGYVVTVNRNTAVENGEGSLEKEAATYEFVQGYYDGFTWCDSAVIPEPSHVIPNLPILNHLCKAVLIGLRYAIT